MAIPSNFYINHNKFQEYSDKAIDWFLRSCEFKHGSDEWLICRLKRKIFMKKALQQLQLARKCLDID